MLPKVVPRTSFGPDQNFRDTPLVFSASGGFGSLLTDQNILFFSGALISDRGVASMKETYITERRGVAEHIEDGRLHM